MLLKSLQTYFLLKVTVLIVPGFFTNTFEKEFINDLSPASREGREKIDHLLKHSLRDYMEYFYEVTWDT